MVDPRITATVAVAIAFIAYTQLFKRYLLRKVDKWGVREAHTDVFRNLLNFSIFLIVLLIISYIWEFHIENLWLYLTSVLGLIAIGFFAVWSILSNIIAGIFILSGRHFRIGDEITIMPEKIKGKVRDIAMMYVVLDSKDGTTLIPNNQLFQKIIKRKRKYRMNSLDEGT